MDSLYFLIPAVIIVLILLPIIMKVRVSFNALENTGVFCVYFFNIKLLYFIFEIKDNELRLKAEDEETAKELDFNSPELALYQELASQIKDKTRLKYLEVYYNIGLNDAFLTSMICGYVNIAALIFFTSIKNKKPSASLGIYDTVSYNKKVVEVAVDLCLSISLFDLAYSFVISVILSKRQLACKGCLDATEKR